jgi:hypothetical protein
MLAVRTARRDAKQMKISEDAGGSPAAHSIPRHSALATKLSEPEVAFIAAIRFYACLTL